MRTKNQQPLLDAVVAKKERIWQHTSFEIKITGARHDEPL